MRVTVEFVGVLADFVGTRVAGFDLREGARYEDLLAEIGLVFGANMPEKLWDRQRSAFRPVVLGTRDERSLRDIRESELRHGDAIKFFLAAAGG